MTDFRTLLVEREGPRSAYCRIFQRLEVRDGVFMSIQGHEGAYCEPRAALDPFAYESMEVALMDGKGDWISPRQNNWPPELAKFAVGIGADKEDEPDEWYWSHMDDVAGYVPIAVIQEVYDILTGDPPVKDVGPPPEATKKSLTDWIKATLVF